MDDIDTLDLGSDDEALAQFARTDIPELSRHMSRKARRKAERKAHKKAAENAVEDYEKAPRAAATWKPAGPVDEEVASAAAKAERLPIKVNHQLQEPPTKPVFETAADKEPPVDPFAKSKGFPAKRKEAAEEAAKKKHAESGSDDADDDDDDENVSDDEDANANYGKYAKRLAEKERREAEARQQEQDTESAVQSEIGRGKKLEQMRAELALLAASIMELPEERVNKLKSLNEFCDCKEAGVANTVKRLAFISTTTVYKDIIPSYHIRPLSEAEQTADVSKDVKKVRIFEQGLLAAYQAFLKILHEHLKKWIQGAGKHTTDKVDMSELPAADRAAYALALTATRCMCDLLRAAPHFNFRNNIIDVLTPLMTGRYSPELLDMVCDAVVGVFKEDQDYAVSHQIVKSMCAAIKNAHHTVNPAMIHCFSSLKIRREHLKTRHKAHDAMRAEQRKNTVPGSKADYVNKRQSKIRKATKAMNKELLELESTTNTARLAHYQTQILSQIFAIYFRVLKFAHRSPLLEAVLEGLSRFADLIDASFFSDLFAVLEALVDDETVTLRIALVCIRTAFVVLSGDASTLTLDAKKFHGALFARMLDVPFEPEHFHLVVICIYAMFIKQHEVSLERVAAFFKRLLGISLHLEHHNAAAALALMRELLRAYPRLLSMVENDLIATGIFMPLAALPEHANALAATVWELTPLHRHYNPYVRVHATHVQAGAPAAGPGSIAAGLGNTLPLDILKRLHPRAQGGFAFNPAFVQLKKLPNPLRLPSDKQSALENIVKDVHWPSSTVRSQFRLTRAAQLMEEKEEHESLLRLWQQSHKDEETTKSSAVAKNVGAKAAKPKQLPQQQQQQSRAKANGHASMPLKKPKATKLAAAANGRVADKQSGPLSKKPAILAKLRR